MKVSSIVPVILLSFLLLFIHTDNDPPPCNRSAGSGPVITEGCGLTTPRPKCSTRASDVVINEYLPDPASDWDGSGELDYGDDEWIELYNKGNAQEDISGWKLDDITTGGTGEYTIPGSTFVGPGQVLLFFGSVTGVGLNNAGDTVNLLDGAGALVDSHTFDHCADDISYARIPDGANDWEEVAYPTPGELNSGAETNGTLALVVDGGYPPAAIDMIESAENYVYVLQYLAFLYPGHPEYAPSRLYSSLIDAHGRGVNVKVLLDDTPSENVETKLYLESNGLDVKMDGGAIKLHSKLIVSDDRILLGSTNWGYRSTTENHETNLKVESIPVGLYFKGYFEDLWSDPAVYPTEASVDTGEIATVVCDQYFSNAEDMIDNAGNRIDLIMYHITEAFQARTLVDKLIGASGRGVRVRVLMEHSGYIDYVDENNAAAREILRAQGVATVLDDDSINTHAKVLLCDDTVLLGSTNWGAESFNSQLNTNLRVTNDSMTGAVGDYFDRLWELHGTTTGSLDISGGTGPEELDFTIGDEVTVTVTDGDANRNASDVEELEVAVSSDRDPGGITVTLAETGPDSGVYSGSFTVSSASDGAQHRIEGREGDTITIVYHDALDFNGTGLDVSKSLVLLGISGEISLSSPPDGAFVDAITVRLNWTHDYDGPESIKYDLVVDDEENPDTVIATSLTTGSYLLEDLVDGTTYYWKVVPLADDVPRDWVSEIRNFTVRLHGTIAPLAPDDGIIITGYSVLLDWEWSYEGNAAITFDVEMKTDEGAYAVVRQGLKGTSVRIWDLEDGVLYRWKVTPLYDGDERGDVSVERSFEVEYPGTIILREPGTEGIVTGPETHLEWVPEYNGSASVTFNVYLGTSAADAKLVAREVPENLSAVTGLADGVRYVWWVTPVIEGTEKEWRSDESGFIVRYAGSVELLSPGNGSTVRGPEVEIEWELHYEGMSEVVFTVYLGENDMPGEAVMTLGSETDLTVKDLENGTTYYWYVQPYADLETVSWSSPVWSFSVKVDDEDEPTDDDTGPGDDDTVVDDDDDPAKETGGLGVNVILVMVGVAVVILLGAGVVGVLVIAGKRKREGSASGIAPGPTRSDTMSDTMSDIMSEPAHGTVRPSGVRQYDSVTFPPCGETGRTTPAPETGMDRVPQPPHWSEIGLAPHPARTGTSSHPEVKRVEHPSLPEGSEEYPLLPKGEGHPSLPEGSDKYPPLSEGSEDHPPLPPWPG